MPYVRFFVLTITMIIFSFDGDLFRETDSKFSHKWTLGLANYKDLALTTGVWVHRLVYVIDSMTS